MLDLLPRDIIKYICIISQNHYVAPRLYRVSRAFSFLDDEERIKITNEMVKRRVDYNYNLSMVIIRLQFYTNTPFNLVNFRIKINPSIKNYFNLRLLGDIITDVKVMTSIKREKITKPCCNQMSIDDCANCFESSDYGFYPNYVFKKEKIKCFDIQPNLKEMIPPIFYNVKVNDLGDVFLYLNSNENKEVDILITCICLLDREIRDELITKYCIWEIFKGTEKNYIEKGYL